MLLKLILQTPTRRLRVSGELEPLKKYILLSAKEKGVWNQYLKWNNIFLFSQNEQTQWVTWQIHRHLRAVFLAHYFLLLLFFQISTYPRVAWTLSIAFTFLTGEVWENEKRQKICFFFFFLQRLPKASRSSYWSEFSHVAITTCKGSWEMFCGSAYWYFAQKKDMFLTRKNTRMVAANVCASLAGWPLTAMISSTRRM